MSDVPIPKPEAPPEPEPEPETQPRLQRHSTRLPHLVTFAAPPGILPLGP